jgi:hypothetical protein
MDARDEIVADVLSECEEDHVGLWRFVTAVQYDLGLREPAEIRKVTLELVSRLLDYPAIEAGFPTPDGRHFTPWRMSKASILQRIEQEWDALGRLPTIGDIVWFSLETAHHVTA